LGCGGHIEKKRKKEEKVAAVLGLWGFKQFGDG
jgi:hypothetical protein